ncbi:unnamed protein product, partial [Pleuronectes platessa]
GPPAADLLKEGSSPFLTIPLGDVHCCCVGKSQRKNHRNCSRLSQVKQWTAQDLKCAVGGWKLLLPLCAPVGRRLDIIKRWWILSVLHVELSQRSCPVWPPTYDHRPVFVSNPALQLYLPWNLLFHAGGFPETIFPPRLPSCA